MNISVKDNIAAERAVGQKYAKLLQDHFKKQVSSLDKRSGTLMKPRYRVIMRNAELKAISVRTLKYAFILHHGVNTDRIQHSLKTRSKKTVTRVEHPFKLQSKIKLDVVHSLVIGFANEIADIRGREVLVEATKALDINENK